MRNAGVCIGGYVTDTAPPPRSPGEVRAELGINGRFIVATAGGGGDGYPLLRMVIQAMPMVPDTTSLVFTGPLMSPVQRARLREKADGSRGIIVRDDSEDLRSYLAAADTVVSMCGYNIAAEIAALRVRAVVVPRTWKCGEHANRMNASDEGEQILRARVLAQLGLVELLEPDGLTPAGLARQLVENLEKAGGKTPPHLDFGGLDAVSRELLDLSGRFQNGGEYAHACE